MFRKHHTQLTNGFTLVELTVAIAIVGVLLTLTSINYRTSNSQSLMTMAAYQVAGDARLVQGYAASARQYGTNGANEWGVYFDKAQPEHYILFVDNNSDGKYIAENDAIFKTMKLPRGVKILKLLQGTEQSSVSANQVSVVYSPPEPAVHLWYTGMNETTPEPSLIKVQLSNDGLLAGKEVTLNFFGLIDVTK